MVNAMVELSIHVWPENGLEEGISPSERRKSPVMTAALPVVEVGSDQSASMSGRCWRWQSTRSSRLFARK